MPHTYTQTCKHCAYTPKRDRKYQWWGRNFKRRRIDELKVVMTEWRKLGELSNRAETAQIQSASRRMNFGGQRVLEIEWRALTHRVSTLPLSYTPAQIKDLTKKSFMSLWESSKIYISYCWWFMWQKKEGKAERVVNGWTFPNRGKPPSYMFKKLFRLQIKPWTSLYKLSPGNQFKGIG